MYRNIQLDNKLCTLCSILDNFAYKPWKNDVCVIGKQNTLVFLHTTLYVTIQIEKGHRINWLTNNILYFCSILHLKKAKTKVNLSGSTYSWVESKSWSVEKKLFSEENRSRRL